MRVAVQLVIPVVVPRAVALWGLIRLVFAALPLAGGQPFASMPPPPVGVVLLSGVVGLIDVRVRGEQVLWANLGVTSIGLFAVYAAAAVPAEFVLALVLR